MPENTEPTVWASIGATIPTGQFKNIKMDIGVSGVPINCDAGKLESIMKDATRTITEVCERLGDELIVRIHEAIEKDA